MKRNTYPKPFEDLWAVFKIAADKGLIGAGGKAAGYEAYKVKKCTPEDAEYLIKCLFNQINAKVRLIQAGDFTPQFQSPERWIRNERFEDSIGDTVDAIAVRPKSDQRKAAAAERYLAKHMDGGMEQAGGSEGDLGGARLDHLRVLESGT